MAKPDFMKQFNPDNQVDMATVIAAFAAMDIDEFLDYWHKLWQDLSEQTIHAATNGLMRNPEQRHHINLLIRFAYRCVSMTELFKMMRDSDTELEPSPSAVDEIRNKMLEHISGERRR